MSSGPAPVRRHELRRPVLELPHEAPLRGVTSMRERETVRRIAATRETGPGRVLVGPKVLGKGYARIVSVKDGSGRIESFDLATRKWLVAPNSVTFAEVWSAPAVPINVLPGLAESD